MQLRLHSLRFRRAEPFEIVDTVGARRRLDLFDTGDLFLAGRDDQLAERGVLTSLLREEVSKPIV